MHWLRCACSPEGRIDLGGGERLARCLCPPVPGLLRPQFCVGTEAFRHPGLALSSSRGHLSERQPSLPEDGAAVGFAVCRSVCSPAPRPSLPPVTGPLPVLRPGPPTSSRHLTPGLRGSPRESPAYHFDPLRDGHCCDWPFGLLAATLGWPWTQGAPFIRNSPTHFRPLCLHPAFQHWLKYPISKCRVFPLKRNTYRTRKGEEPVF